MKSHVLRDEVGAIVNLFGIVKWLIGQQARMKIGAQ